MEKVKRISVVTPLLFILLLVNTAIAVEKEISDKKDAEDHIKLAEEYVEKNQFNEAIEEYTKAISLKPDDASLYYARASCYRQNAQIEKAIKDYEQLVIILFNVAGPSIIKLNREDVENLTPEKAQKLKDKLRAWESEISALVNLISLISLYKQENRLEDAIKFCSKVISLRPKNVSLYGLRANLYEELKQYDKAIEDYTKSIELKPDDANSYFSRGSVYVELKQHDKAIEDYTKLIELEPDNANSYPLRGTVYALAGQYREAKADYQKACDLKKDSCNILTEFERKLAEIEKWPPLGKSENRFIYYDKTSIRKQPNGHIRVWMKEMVKDIPTYVEERKKEYRKTVGYENYSHSLMAWEIDCDSASLGVISLIDYDGKGKVLDLHNRDEKSLEMTPVVPDSIGDLLYKMVCKEER
jgi:tetratricopeptide (TPR) repeat protein